MNEPGGADPGNPAADPMLGRIIDGRYTLLQLIGRGGMGSVYRAHQASLERAVAVKILAQAPSKAREAEFQSRFFFEASTAARLKHPNTITVFDYGSDIVADEKVLFIAMEYLDGVTLTRALKNEQLTVPQAVHVILQVCRSLREAHEAGVVHRDLKPGNIMLLRQGDEDDADEHFVKVLDFGLAKTFSDEEKALNLTRVGTFLGSPRYVSPEQIEGRAIDGRADIYSLGCVMYRMLEGRVPFDGDTPVEVMLKHLNKDPPPMESGIPRALESLVRDCLMKEADTRPQTMSDVIDRLKGVRAGLSGQIPRQLWEEGSREDRVPRASPPPSPVPLTKKKRPRDDTASTGHRHRPPVGQTDLSDHRPARATSLPARAAPGGGRVALVGIAFGALLALLVFGGLKLGLHRRDPPPPPPMDPQPVEGTRVKVKVKTEPAAGVRVFEIRGTQAEMLGQAPMTLDWRFVTGTPRVLEFRKEGFHTARYDVSPPAAAQEGDAFEVEVKLVAR